METFTFPASNTESYSQLIHCKKLEQFFSNTRKFTIKIFQIRFSAKRIIDQEELPTFYSDGIAWGGCGMKILYLLTASTDSEPNNVIVQPPAGQLIILRGLGRGIGVRRPCLSCY